MSRTSLLSPLWYRVAYLQPRLKAGVRIARHTVRGRLWYVLTDPISGRHHRFDAQAYALVAACDGSATIDTLWARRVDADGDAAATQGQAIDIFAQAFAANLLSGDVAADARAAMRAHKRRQARQRRAALNPLSFRLPLGNPDRWLSAHGHRVRWLFGTVGVSMALVLMALAALLFAVNASDLAREAARNLEQGRVLLLLWLTYPLIKLLHEAAHALAVKAYGGDVHEVGVAMLMLTPVPYVDASAASAFENKRKRAIVAGAGIAVEWLMAGAALVVWQLVQPGLLRDLALAVTVAASVSTLLVNGNPLLRFDGYHVLCDLLELPNLAQRSSRWWHLRLQRAALGAHAGTVDDSVDSATGSERIWLALYAPASWLVRGALTLALAMALTSWNAWIGIALLALACWWMIGAPLVAVVKWLATAPQLHVARARAFVVGAGTFALLAAFTLLAPLPHRTMAPGVVWLPDEALVRPVSDGFVEQVFVVDGQKVDVGTPLMKLRNEPLELEMNKVAAELTQHRVEHLAALSTDASRAAQAADRMHALQVEHERLRQRVQALEVRAGAAGRVAIDARRIVPGRWLSQGDVAAHVLAPGAAVVRALVAHDDMADLRGFSTDAGTVDVVLAHSGQSGTARWLRSAPAASRHLISSALGAHGGGPIAVDPEDRQGRTALEPRFEIELQLPHDTRAHVGERAWVSFRHGDTTLASWSVGFVRRTFLRHFATGATA
jgi:putative peptide zinc metalloprotease protein